MIKISTVILLFTTHIACGQMNARNKVPKQPYFKYIVPASGMADSVTFYLSEFAAQTPLPLIVYIQGSGSSSLFSKDNTGRILPGSGHIDWAYEAKEKAKVLIVEKPGVGFLESASENKNFDNLFSLDSWAMRIENAIRYVIANEKIDTAKILIAGHSEGGLVAARVAKQLRTVVTHTAILAGEGPSQLYSLYKFAATGDFFNSPGSSEKQRKDSLLNQWKMIAQEPLSTTKKFWGFTYLRWSSFLQTSVLEELKDYQGKIFIIQGDKDKNVHPETALLLYTGLLAKGRNATLEIVPGADHSFSTGQFGNNGWQAVVTKCINWFLK